MSKLIAVLAVGRERTEEEKLRRHLHGDRGAKFSQGKRLCLLGGGNRLCHDCGNERQFSL